MFETLFLTPKLNAVSCNAATEISMPYFLTAIAAPERPLEKFFITVSSGIFVNEDISPASIVKAFDVAIDASPIIPTEFVICAICASNFVTCVISSPRLAALVSIRFPFLSGLYPVILPVRVVSLSSKLSA